HRKHVNDLEKRSPALRPRFLTGRQKNRSTRNQVLVSRKAMQNYNRFFTWQNVSTTFFKKNQLFLCFSHIFKDLYKNLAKNSQK
ncbi:MAG: hypothetical protein J5629_00825, partial [Muribaculaceae bacterium]|nr:hypothetical protein [Muribaculaceae bacterium]